MSACKPSLKTHADWSATLGQLRRSEIFVATRPSQNLKLRRSGILHRLEYIAPTELKNYSDARTTNISLLRSFTPLRLCAFALNDAILKSRQKLNPKRDLCKSAVAALCERRKRVNLLEKRWRSQTATTEKVSFAEVSERVALVNSAAWFAYENVEGTEKKLP